MLCISDAKISLVGQSLQSNSGNLIVLQESIALSSPEMYDLIPGSPEHRMAIDEVVAEANVLAAVQHPNVLRCLGVVVDERGQPRSLMTEYAQFGNVQSYLEWRDKLSMVEFIEMLRQVTSAVAHMHELHFLHRDIKPANILVVDNGDGSVTYKLGDVGNSRSAGRSGRAMTQVGTPFYMAPEVGGGVYNTSADVFSLGMVMCELALNNMVGGTPTPVRGLSPYDRPRLINSAEDMFIRLGFRELAGLVVSCCDDTPARRPTARDVLNLLVRLVLDACMSAPMECFHLTVDCLQTAVLARVEASADAAAAAAIAAPAVASPPAAATLASSVTYHSSTIDVTEADSVTIWEVQGLPSDEELAELPLGFHGPFLPSYTIIPESAVALLRMLGKGSYGVVHKATMDGRFVCVKVWRLLRVNVMGVALHAAVPVCVCVWPCNWCSCRPCTHCSIPLSLALTSAPVSTWRL